MKNENPGRVLIILILGALISVSPFTIDMYLPAFKQIASDFKTTPAKISLSVTSYFIGLAIGQLFYGPLLDRYGRKPPLYGGLIFYIVASIACTLAGSVESLVAFRFLQALGGCVAMVASMTMVRDFFAQEESAKIFSLLMLILGSSPLLAPTVGGFIATSLGWKWIFIALALIAAIILLITYFFLPEKHGPDTRVSLKAKPMIATFISVLKQRQFLTYTVAGAFSFSTMFIYVAGSPVIFLDIFKIKPQVYGGIFALLSIGFIGSNQLNILLLRKFKSEKIFIVALACQMAFMLLFLVGTYTNWLGLTGVIVMFFLCLACLGLTYPNASALALAPFTRNVGTASALLGFMQIGLAGLTSSAVGFLNVRDSFPVVAMMTCTTVIAVLITLLGRRPAKNIGPAQSANAGKI